MIIKLNKKIVNIVNGQPLNMSFPTAEQVAKLPKLDNGNPDASKLPNETVKNMLLNCLANYEATDRKEIFRVYALGIKLHNISDEIEEIEIEDANKEIIEKMLDAAISIKGKMPQENKGIYLSWAIAQAFDACGLMTQ